MHNLVERRLKRLLRAAYPDSFPVEEVHGVLGGRNDLIQFFFNGRRVVFELFFSASQVPQDLRLLEQAAADVRIAVLMDEEIDRRVADEYFRRKPEHFPYLRLKQVLLAEYEPFVVARLRELIDEDPLVLRVRRVLATPHGPTVERHLDERLRVIEEALGTASKPRLDPSTLTHGDLMAARVVQEVAKLGVPVARLGSFYQWLRKAIPFGVELVVVGLGAYVVTDLNEQHAIYSAGDTADDVIMYGYVSTDATVVVPLTELINASLEQRGFERRSIQFHFIHTYAEHVNSIEWAWGEKWVPKFPQQPSGTDDAPEAPASTE